MHTIKSMMKGQPPLPSSQQQVLAGFRVQCLAGFRVQPPHTLLSKITASFLCLICHPAAGSIRLTTVSVKVLRCGLSFWAHANDHVRDDIHKEVPMLFIQQLVLSA